jgi:1,2-diacylglycerol 3-alpha-glucosyltransferase
MNGLGENTNSVKVVSKDSQVFSFAELLQQGRALVHLGQYEKAQVLLEAALKQGPESFFVHFELGVLYHRKNEHEKAIHHFQTAHSLNEKDAKSLNNLGVIYYISQNFNHALDCFLRATKTGPKYFDAYYGAAKSFYALGQFQGAFRYFKKCLLLNPGHPEVESQLALLSNDVTAPEIGELKIGFVSIWFERGQAYVTKLIKDALDKDHETFVFARTGRINGKSMLETGGIWDVPNLSKYPEYKIKPNDLKDWIFENQLDVVVFNEEYDWELVQAAKATDVMVLTYLDYYKEEWRANMGMYDGVLCSTFRTFNLVKPLCNAYYIGWAVDNNIYKPKKDPAKHTFFHNAGWLGNNYRKMTPAVLLAFDALSKVLPEITLFIHSQDTIDKLPSDIQNIVTQNDRITFHVETVPAPGLYSKGLIHIFPTKLEGLGLPLMEGLSCGLPAITPNAPPMNEFVRDGYNGLLVKIGKEITRNDNIAFPETIVDINDLVEKMKYLATHPKILAEMQNNALKSVEENLSFTKMQNRLEDILLDVLHE